MKTNDDDIGYECFLDTKDGKSDVEIYASSVSENLVSENLKQKFIKMVTRRQIYESASENFKQKREQDSLKW